MVYLSDSGLVLSQVVLERGR